jgi:hypothetical protein
MQKNQKFVLFGPAPHVLRRNYRFPAEYHICRVGNVFPLTSDMVHATGSHTDYWYPANQLLLKKQEVCNSRDIRFIRTTKTGSRLIPATAIHKWSRTSWELNNLQNKLGCMPNRGLRAMIDILAQDPIELIIIGITFYHGEPYYEGYTGEEHYQLTKEKRGDLGNHKQDPQIRYFIENILPHPAVKIDDELKRVVCLVRD